jgi:LEA14-like dessication related protein
MHVFNKLIGIFSSCEFKELPKVIAKFFPIPVRSTQIDIYLNGIK